MWNILNRFREALNRKQSIQRQKWNLQTFKLNKIVKMLAFVVCPFLPNINNSVFKKSFSELLVLQRRSWNVLQATMKKVDTSETANCGKGKCDFHHKMDWKLSSSKLKSNHSKCLSVNKRGSHPAKCVKWISDFPDTSQIDYVVGRGLSEVWFNKNSSLNIVKKSEMCCSGSLLTHTQSTTAISSSCDLPE